MVALVILRRAGPGEGPGATEGEDADTPGAADEVGPIDDEDPSGPSSLL
jgi:hypothetical protein